MKKIKKIIPIIIAFIIGISTTVGAATVFNSKDITYSSSVTTKKNVKDSLDELYNKVGKCPDGQYCYDSPKPLSLVELGDYISMTPSSTSYTISKSLTGYTSDQKINPSKLNLWRVISKNSDGTVDIVSHYVSGEKVTFQGKTGYMNYVGTLNTIAAQYTNSKYVQSTRHMGYNGQIKNCSFISEIACPTDTGYENDVHLVTVAMGYYGSLAMGSGENAIYWLASRLFYNESNLLTRTVRTENENNKIENGYLYGNGVEANGGYSVRPILTLKADTKFSSGGDGKTYQNAYVLE